MKTKQLEKYYKEYQTKMGSPVVPEGNGAVIYSTEDFHLNFKQKTLYIKGIGVMEMPDLSEESQSSDWLAIWRKEEVGDELDLALGLGNPYTELYHNMLPTINGIILAVPNTILSKVMKGVK